jgi:lipopolysaccharide transport system permease protein
MQAALSWRQTKTFTLASIKSRYRNTFAGFLWVICGPLLVYGVQAYVFSEVLKINYDNYLLFLLSGLLPWIFFNQSISMSTTLISTQARLLKSFPIHPLTSLVALVLDNLINLALTFVFIFIFILIFSSSLPPFHFLPLLPSMISLLIWTVSVGWLLSISQVFFYDTKFVVDYGMNILFYMTPIFYPAKLVPENLRWIVEYNPVAIVLAPFQAVSQVAMETSFELLIAKSFFVSLTMLVLVCFVWSRQKNALYFKL